MELKYLKLIKTIAEEGSLSNATDRLYLTQSALSHQLKDLELQLGFKVFNRRRNQWQLTAEGEELYKLANTVLANIESGFQQIRKIRMGSVGNIKLSTECYSFYQELPRFIQKMGMLYPDIEVEFNLDATHQPINKLLSKEIDLALVTEKKVQDQLTYVELYEDEIFALLHLEHPFSKIPYLTAEQLAQVHLIIHSFPLETVSVYQHFLHPLQIMPAKISAIPLTEVALELVKANMGVICMPKWALRSFHLSNELCFKRLGKNGLKRKHYLVLRKEDQAKKYIQDFISNFQEENKLSIKS